MSVRITCRHCDREIWQDVADYITLGDARRAECSDCVIDRALRRYNAKLATRGNANSNADLHALDISILESEG